MQRYPKSTVFAVEKLGATFRFERRNGKNVCFIVDKDTGKVIAQAEGANELDALDKAIPLAEKAPKPMSDRDAAARIRELEARLAEVEAGPAPKRGKKSDQQAETPDPEQASET